MADSNAASRVLGDCLTAADVGIDGSSFVYSHGNGQLFRLGYLEVCRLYYFGIDTSTPNQGNFDTNVGAISWRLASILIGYRHDG